MKKALLLLLIAALFAAGIVSPAVSAADIVHGKDVHDYVLIGEKGLDFREFVQDGSTFIAPVSGEDAQMDKSISISNPGSVDLNQDDISVSNPTRYYAVKTDSSSKPQVNWSVYCFISPTKTVSIETDDAALVNNAMTFTLKGNPGASYQVYVGGEKYGNELSMGRKSANPEKTFTYTPSQAGTVTISVVCTASGIPDEVGKTAASYTISVSAKTMNVKMSIEIPADAKAGIFATGDIIELSGSIENIKYAEEPISNVYLYITGRNLDANGVNLETKTAVVDGNSATFTETKFDSEKGTWEYDWKNTGLFEPGTYTIYAVTQTKGQLSALDIGITPASTELYLSDKSIHVKFAEENGGLFTQGDVMYSYWSARGSPNAVRWYIIGPNYLETGIEEDFSLYTADQKKGENAPQGVWGFVYDRYVSRDMAAGNYYLVFQHPGYNNEFDVFPDNTGNGYFSALDTTFGESSSLAGRPSSNCAEVLKELIDDILCDDLCIIADLTIESPWISIDHVENLEIGDKLKIKGKTNYAGEGTPVDGRNVENTFSLRIDRLNFDITEENAAMQLQIVNRVVPENIIPYEGERTYEFDEIDTSTWFAGTYQATVTNIDTGFEESIMFTVGGEGTQEDSSTLNVPSNPTEEPYEELEPLPPIERYEEPTEPEEPKSPGFILAPLALAAAFILRRK